MGIGNFGAIWWCLGRFWGDYYVIWRGRDRFQVREERFGGRERLIWRGREQERVWRRTRSEAATSTKASGWHWAFCPRERRFSRASSRAPAPFASFFSLSANEDFFDVDSYTACLCGIIILALMTSWRPRRNSRLCGKFMGRPKMFLGKTWDE